MGLGITLTVNEIKDIKIVTRFLENGGILLKGTSRKISCQLGGLLNFLGPLMRTGLPLIKSVLISLAKSVLVPLGLTAAAFIKDAVIQRKGVKSGTTLII